MLAKGTGCTGGSGEMGKRRARGSLRRTLGAAILQGCHVTADWPGNVMWGLFVHDRVFSTIWGLCL